MENEKCRMNGYLIDFYDCFICIEFFYKINISVIY